MPDRRKADWSFAAWRIRSPFTASPVRKNYHAAQMHAMPHALKVIARSGAPRSTRSPACPERNATSVCRSEVARPKIEPAPNTWAFPLSVGHRRGGDVTPERRKYDSELREGAVKITPETGKPISEVAREFGIGAGTLGDWVKKDRLVRGDESGTRVDPAHVRQLAREVAELPMERDVHQPSVVLVGQRGDAVSTASFVAVQKGEHDVRYPLTCWGFATRTDFVAECAGEWTSASPH